MRTATLMALTAVFSSLVACGEAKEDFSKVLPDERVLVNLPEADGQNARTGEWSEYYLITADVTHNVNGLAASVLTSVDLVTRLEPTYSVTDGDETVALWGPFDGDALEPTTTQLWVSQAADGSYTWAIEARPKNDTEAAFTAVVLGQVEAGATEEISRGTFYIDFDALTVLDPNTDALGKFAITYDIGATGVTAEAGFENFVDENGELANAMYSYEQLYGGDGAMDLVIESDIDGGSTAQEALVIRSRWQATGAGRSDAYVVGGDLGDFTGTASECWGSDFQSSYYIDNFTPLEEGDVASCVFAEPEFNEEDDVSDAE